MLAARKSGQIHELRYHKVARRALPSIRLNDCRPESDTAECLLVLFAFAGSETRSDRFAAVDRTEGNTATKKDLVLRVRSRNEYR
ncbi:hypothetical protein pRL70097 (plasmid) [Rhizobium johnstonii 3841]|uniref:Uncharacterized protein n=1 Tax=Rhizobium johnstonii (strain DSM 114642 / LMG 32736 / 3841) TaxID=216596 RepID=Q1M9T2_RHIJ3|nr:hypothetical protein pRL70097 [Rhizobium johnstonii 3841]